MAKLPIVTYPHPVLSRVADPVAEITPEISQFIADMLETMYEGDGVGLAAPQVNKSLRIITLDETGPKERKKPMVLVNPVFVTREGQRDSEESCLSLPTFSCKLKRYERVAVRGLNEKGEEVEVAGEGLLAIILQHEIDHLDGRTLLDHASRLKRTMYETKVKKWRKD
ncbi:peptide deformylase [Humidesulfovibrio mexicanus]|uniref:Peptide deformylase n=1 Tax=Humidesulfovibrio mexicanus TaxID=147047 RepID=A0A239BSD9_9BACT|nr:peptide deformylase [Humidesulfovibrio mexicanus]SNS10328.1 peptide deformylase [Humidesulfovibrio mexicanus]